MGNGERTRKDTGGDVDAEMGVRCTIMGNRRKRKTEDRKGRHVE